MITTCLQAEAPEVLVHANAYGDVLVAFFETLFDFGGGDFGEGGVDVRGVGDDFGEGFKNGSGDDVEVGVGSGAVESEQSDLGVRWDGGGESDVVGEELGLGLGGDGERCGGGEGEGEEEEGGGELHGGQEIEC